LRDIHRQTPLNCLVQIFEQFLECVAFGGATGNRSLPRAHRFLWQSDYQYLWHVTQMARNSNDRLRRAEQQFLSHHVPAFGIAAGDVTVRFEDEKHCLGVNPYERTTA